jgi:hypothetical protein
MLSGASLERSVLIGGIGNELRAGALASGEDAVMLSFAKGGMRGAPNGIVWNPITGPGPLGAEIANTFRSATYVERTLDEPLTLYRVYGVKSGKLGSYWTTTKPSGGLQSQLDLALLTEWGGVPAKTATIKVPKGTTIFEGVAAPQTGKVKTFENLMGGGTQVYIPRVDPNWLVK